MTNKPGSTAASRKESAAVAFENVALCAAAIAAQLRDPDSTALIPESCRVAGVDLGDLTDGEASAEFIVVAVAAAEEVQK